MFCCIKTSFVLPKIARICKHVECEHKKRLNFCTHYKISTAFCDFIPKCRNWRLGVLSMRLKIKKEKKDQNKNNKSKQKTTTTKYKIVLRSWDSNHGLIATGELYHMAS